MDTGFNIRDTLIYEKIGLHFLQITQYHKMIGYQNHNSRIVVESYGMRKNIRYYVALRENLAKDAIA